MTTVASGRAVPASQAVGRLDVALLGPLTVRREGDSADVPITGRARELLAYILVFRCEPQHREVVSDVLWGAAAGADPRKILRQALWQLNRSCRTVITARDDWLRLNRDAIARLDVHELERAYDQVKGLHGPNLTEDDARKVRTAVDRYTADLLSGWYQEWTHFERQRLKAMYLAMLEKLLAWHEARYEYELGLMYAQQLLRHDHAHERTHVRMMRMHYLSGDRTGAIRQFALCVRALDEELAVRPAAHTLALYQAICADELGGDGR